MDADRIQEYMAQARSMIDSGRFDEKVYDEIEDFILKNGSKLGKSYDFQELKEIMTEAAARFGKKNISEDQENFGLNSCAQ